MSASEIPDANADAAFERRLAAVSQAVDDYHRYLLDYLYRLTSQWQDAENLLQDLWRHVLLHFKEDQIHTLPLLRRKAYQLFVDHYRRQVRRGEVLSDELPEVPSEEQSSPRSRMKAKPPSEKKFWAEYPGIDLTEPQKGSALAPRPYGFTFKEIESQTGVPASTVGDWIALARKKLAAVINNEPQTK